MVERMWVLLGAIGFSLTGVAIFGAYQVGTIDVLQPVVLGVVLAAAAVSVVGAVSWLDLAFKAQNSERVEHATKGS